MQADFPYQIASIFLGLARLYLFGATSPAKIVRLIKQLRPLSTYVDRFLPVNLLPPDSGEDPQI